MELYGYFRSSAAYRVRIVLNLKGLPYNHHAVHLVKREHLDPAYTAINPEALVPTLIDQDHALTQSMAICEYLEETHPTPSILPQDALGRARVRSLAAIVACEIHPLNNLRVLRYLVNDLNVTEEAKNAWYQHWIAEGLTALEAQLAGSKATGTFCHGDTPTIADAFLIPQVFNAQRFKCDLSPMPTIRRIADYANTLPQFQKAAPGAQPDAE